VGRHAGTGSRNDHLFQEETVAVAIYQRHD
jgi:hypothetical protein